MVEFAMPQVQCMELVRLGLARSVVLATRTFFARKLRPHNCTHDQHPPTLRAYTASRGSSDRIPHTASTFRSNNGAFHPNRDEVRGRHAQSSYAKPRELTKECSAGYALLKSKDKKLFGKEDGEKDASAVVDSLKLKKFQKFENAVTALNEAAALTDGKVSTMLSSLLQELKDETKASCTLCAPTKKQQSFG
jgi:hypothetical protein